MEAQKLYYLGTPCIKIDQALNFHMPRKVFFESFAEIDLSWCNMIKVIKSPLSGNSQNRLFHIKRCPCSIAPISTIKLPSATSFRLLL